MTNLHPADLMTSAQARTVLLVSQPTLSRLVKAGKLRPAYKCPGLRGAMLFDPADVTALAEQRNRLPVCECEAPDLDDLGACRICKRKPLGLLRISQASQRAV